MPDARIVLAGVRALARNLHRLAPEEFGYLVLDEPHHARARSRRAVIDPSGSGPARPGGGG